jgi:hypothetical protein
VAPDASATRTPRADSVGGSLAVTLSLGF